MSMLNKGDRIQNYLLEECLGVGSFGEVWRGRHHMFGDLVAIKVPTDPQYVRNLQREGVAVHGLKHANIVRAIDLDPYGDPPYFIMEYIDGPSLRQVIDHYQKNIPISTVMVIMQGVLQGLTAAHGDGLVHRDVKPANILLNVALASLAEVSVSSVKVTDFGLGQAVGMTTQSIMQSGSLQGSEGRSVAGTLAYMSPEQKEGRAVDARSDLYSCGIVLFELLTGERPVGGEKPSELRPEVPAHLDGVFEKCYTRRDARFASATEMLAAMTERPVLDEVVPRLTPPPVPAHVHSSAKLKCGQCQRVIKADDQFCIHCGQQIAAAVPKCHACQSLVRANDRFCIHCGVDLSVLVE